MTPADPRSWFPQFYGNPAVQALADAHRWTISGQIGEATFDADGNEVAPTRKAPIDIRHLIAGCDARCRHEGPIRGAWATDQTCLVTLDELTGALPAASNAAFYLQAQTDGLIVIDIEPDCPSEIAADLLRLPGILYDELSMSGRGFHLLAPIPKNMHDFPVAAGKRKLQEKHGWYEILLDHWVTFTRNPVAQVTRDHVAALTRAPQFATVEELYASLAENARETTGAAASAVITGNSMPQIAYSDQIVEQTLVRARKRVRQREAFDNDLSRWEFSVLGTLHGCMQMVLRGRQATGVSYSSEERTWLLYTAALELIPDRPKHAQLRNGRPFLLDRAASLVAERDAAEQLAQA